MVKQVHINLTVTGIPLDPATEYTLFAGRWNWLGYPFQDNLPIVTALQEIAEHIVIILTDDGRFWIPDMGVNMIDEMQPGEGYFAFVDEDVTFRFSER